ncbi:hypothetical protein [Pseudorhodobacter ferrugineus]|uniref:hypothetical protein n=1 Tax=Pseudorhodobacter ferrugineus TaxID=77008 RepID=UPI0018CE7D81|nr:hypothetical protein [Pseudorhodobacter ferrugineus]
MGHLCGSHVQAIYQTLISLLAATGMRISEAIGLGDFDAASGMVTIRHGKFDKAGALRCIRAQSRSWATTCTAMTAPDLRACRPC